MDMTTNGNVVVAHKVRLASCQEFRDKPKPYLPLGKDKPDSRTIEEIEADLKREWLEAAGFAP